MSNVCGSSPGGDLNHSEIDYTEDAVPVRTVAGLEMAFFQIDEVPILKNANDPKVNPSEPEEETKLDQSLLLLNDDCLLNIFSYLRLKDLVRVEKVCWRFKSLMEFVYKSYKELNLSNEVDHNSTMMNVKDMLSNVGPFATHFGAHRDALWVCNDLVLAMVGRYCTNLTSLTLENFYEITDDSIPNLHILFRKLKKLSMQECQITDKDLSLLLKASDNKLEEINLSCIDGITGSCFQYFTNLKVVNIAQCTNVQPEHFISLITQNKNIEDLNIIYCTFINPLCITAIVKELTQLRKLYITPDHPSYFLLADLPNLIFLCVECGDTVGGVLLLKLSEKNQLEYLDISKAFMYKVTTVPTVTALQGLKSLKTLKMSRLSFREYFAVEILRVICDLKQLEEVELVECSEITDDGVINLIKSCKNLRNLDLSGCLKITNRFVLDVMKVIEGRPQMLKVIVSDTKIEKTVYTDNNLNPCQNLQLYY